MFILPNSWILFEEDEKTLNLLLVLSIFGENNNFGTKTEGVKKIRLFFLVINLRYCLAPLTLTIVIYGAGC